MTSNKWGDSAYKKRGKILQFSRNKLVVNQAEWACQKYVKKIQLWDFSVKYWNNYEVTNHKNLVHANIKNFECHVCNKKFGETSKLKHHVKSVHYGGKNYECQICATRFFTSQLLNYHYKHIHMKLKPFECHICKHTFAQESGLYNSLMYYKFSLA